MNPGNTLFSLERFIGRNISEVDEEFKQIIYRVVRVGYFRGWGMVFGGCEWFFFMVGLILEVFLLVGVC